MCGFLGKWGRFLFGFLAGDTCFLHYICIMIYFICEWKGTVVVFVLCPTMFVLSFYIEILLFIEVFVGFLFIGIL